MEKNEPQKPNPLKIGGQIIKYAKEHPEQLQEIVHAWEMNRQYSHEIKMLQESNRQELQKMVCRYELVRDVLTAVFAERTQALSGHYAVLDRALQTDDKELIIKSLQGISNIVSQNPLESFNNFTKILDVPEETLLLDF